MSDSVWEVDLEEASSHLQTSTQDTHVTLGLSLTIFCSSTKHWLSLSLESRLCIRPLINTLLLFYKARTFFELGKQIFFFSNLHSIHIAIQQLHRKPSIMSHIFCIFLQHHPAIHSLYNTFGPDWTLPPFSYICPLSFLHPNAQYR